MLRLAEKAFWPGPLPVPGDARRHRPQLPRGHRVPRPAGGRARRPAGRRLGAGRRSTRAGSSRRPARGPAATGCRPTTLLDAIEEHRLRRRVRRRPARRGEGPGQGAGVLLPGRVRAVGPEEPAARAVEPLQRPAPQGRAHPGVPDLATGPSSTSGSTSQDEEIELPSIYFAHDREVFRAGRHAAGGQRVRHRAWRARRFETIRSATARSATRRAPARSSRGAAPSRTVIAEVAATRITERGATRADDRTSRGRHGGSQAGGVLLMAELLRFATAGSVDDGKSTLIGRLLYDSKAIFEDQLEAVERPASGWVPSTRTSRCSPTACGPSASRASRSTWPTATSPRRSGSSSSPTPRATSSTRATWSPVPPPPTWRSILVDARNGIVEQSRRHTFLASLLRIPHLVVVREQDGPGRLRPRSASTRSRTSSASSRRSSTIGDLTFMPISALHGDNVVDRSANMPWYDGSSLLHHLEEVHIASDRNLIDPRFPVQYVIRPLLDEYHDYRGYAGTMVGGTVQARATRSSSCRRGSPRRSRRSTRPTGGWRRRSRRCRSRSRSTTRSTSRAAT